MTRVRMLSVCAAVTAATVAFAAVQNAGGARGGAISVPKMLWLNLALLAFLALPALAALDPRTPPGMRWVFGFVAASFLLRAAVQLPVLYLTDAWRCSYGIAHDLATVGGLGVLWVRAAPARQDPDAGPLRSLLALIAALLLVEAAFAQAFCSITDPATGIWFADGAPAYRAINRATWAVVAVAYPLLAVVLRRVATPGTATRAAAA